MKLLCKWLGVSSWCFKPSKHVLKITYVCKTMYENVLRPESDQCLLETDESSERMYPKQENDFLRKWSWKIAFIVYLPQWRQADTCHLICKLPWLLPTSERLVIKTSVFVRGKKRRMCLLALALMLPVGRQGLSVCSNLSISTVALRCHLTCWCLSHKYRFWFLSFFFCKENKLETTKHNRPNVTHFTPSHQDGCSPEKSCNLNVHPGL